MVGFKLYMIYMWIAAGQDIMGENSDTKNCLTGTYSSSGSPSYQAVSCSDTQVGNELICQVKCETQGGKCYHAVNKSSTYWYNAQSVCQERYGGDLLLELPPRYSDRGNLTAWLSIGDTVWIGTWRQPWRWNCRSADWINMRYFNWAPGEGGRFSADPLLCTVIRSDTGLWQDVPCDQTYQHVLCVDEIISTPPITSTPTHETSTPPQTTTTVTMDRSTPSSTQRTVDETIDSDEHTLTGTSRDDNAMTTSGLYALSVKSGTSGFRLEYTAAVVTPLLVIIVSVSVAVVCTRRRKIKKQTAETTYVNTDTPSMENTEIDYAPLASPHLTIIPNNVYDHLDNQTPTGDDIQAADYYNLPVSDQSTEQEQSQSGHDGLTDVASCGTMKNMLQVDAHYENVQSGIPWSEEQSLQRPYGNINYGDYTGDYEMV